MRTWKWVLLAALIPVAGATVLLVLRPWQKQDGVAKHASAFVPEKVPPPHPSLVGTPSCSARGCHGSSEPISDTGLRRDEYTTWVRNDVHAAAYRVLFGKLAKDMMAALAAKAPAHEDPRCLACHALPATAEKGGPTWMRLDGVGCEACHGAARQWLEPHTAAQWAKRSAEEKQKLGMTPLDDAVALARACAGCHVGAPEDKEQGIPARDVNHDLLAAGHPRLNFELSAFLANLPVHWSGERGALAGRKEQSVRTWEIGQVVSARAALDLLAWRAGLGEQSWPELAEYDCFSCHHDLKKSSGQGARDFEGGKLGRLSWGSWYFSLLPMLPTGREKDVAVVKRLRELLEGQGNDVKTVAEEARSSARVLKEWEDRLRKEVAIGGPRQRLQEGVKVGRHNWDRAMQLALAAGVLEQDKDQQAIGKLWQRLAFPQGRNSPETFTWDEDFARQLEEVIRGKGKEGR